MEQQSISQAGNPVPRDSEGPLILTYLNTFQQGSSFQAQLTRSRHKGKLMMTSSIPPRFCHSRKYVIRKIVNSKNVFETKTIPCNSYSCPNCQKNKAEAIKYLFRDVILLNQLDHLLTLTLDPKKIPIWFLSKDEEERIQNYTHKYITWLFNKFVLSIKRKAKKAFKYAWVIEFQGNGNAHMHILFNKFLPIRLLKREWTRIGGGHDMKVEIVRDSLATAAYITTYIIKGFKDGKSGYGFRFSERRYSISHSCLRSKVPAIPHIRFNNEDEFKQTLGDDQGQQVYNAFLTPQQIANIEFIKMFKKA